uniref:DDE_3 domain-containing protein n=1 Tax=Heterorhabditis bacteriophora TaxID=37862 RepID=A0A1I7WCR6_HETBA
MIAPNSTVSLDEIRSIYCPTAGRDEEVPHFNSRSQEMKDGLCSYTDIVDFGMDWSNSPFSHVHLLFQYKLHSIQVIFNVEKKFKLGGPDEFTSYWIDLRKERTFPQKNFIFKQDNAAIHVSCSAKDWFRRRNIVLMDWPSRSPDLVPMKNLWRILARQVYVQNRQLSSIEDLKKTASEEWSKIDPAILKNLSTNMTERIFQVMSGKG